MVTKPAGRSESRSRSSHVCYSPGCSTSRMVRTRCRKVVNWHPRDVQGRSVATQVTVICWSSTIPGAGRAGTNTQLRLYGEHRLHGYFDSCLRLPCRARHNSTPQANKEAEAAAAGTWKHETIVVQLTGRRNRWCAFRNVVDANPGKATLETGWFHCPSTGAVGDQE